MHVPLPPLLDVVAPALPLAQAIGRWGNYFNQELFGLPSRLPWAVRITNQAQLGSISPPSLILCPFLCPTCAPPRMVTARASGDSGAHGKPATARKERPPCISSPSSPAGISVT